MAHDPAHVEPLFGEAASALAERQGSASHFRWLATSDDPEAVELRAALEWCFKRAGPRGVLLRSGLQHERWGQHAGALAHLLTIGLLAAQGWHVSVEPEFGRQSPDVLAVRDGSVRVLVEVRSITGAGAFPWAERRASGRPLAPDAREALRETIAGILHRKAEVYRPLVERLAIAFVICLYEDKDTEISALARDLLFGRGDGARDPSEPRDPRGGAFGDPASALAHVSAVIVFGRLDTPGGELRLQGDLLENPSAAVPLPPAAHFPLLRRYGLDASVSPPRARWLSPPPAPFALGGE